MLSKLPQEIRDIVYGEIFQDAMPEMRMFRGTCDSRAPLNPKTLDVCRRPETTDYQWLFVLFAVHETILSDLMSAWARHNKFHFSHGSELSRLFDKDYWHEDTNPYDIVHELSIPLSGSDRDTDHLLDVDFQPHTNFTFYRTIFDSCSHLERSFDVLEAHSKGVTLPGDHGRDFSVPSQLCSRGRKVTMEISEWSDKAKGFQSTRLTFQDWAKKSGRWYVDKTAYIYRPLFTNI
jgi:hypothetical protein